MKGKMCMDEAVHEKSATYMSVSTGAKNALSPSSVVE